MDNENKAPGLISYGEPVEAWELAKNKCFEYNNIPFRETEKRDTFIKSFLGKTRQRITIVPPFNCDFGYNIEVGEDFFANMNLTILDGAKVKIGKNAYIAPNVGIYTATHPLVVKERIKGIEFVHPITIGDNVWIGAHAIILPGVTIGDNSVIGAGSVVTRDIPANVVAAGNPCRVMRALTQEESGENKTLVAEQYKTIDFSALANDIFKQATLDYHISDSMYTPMNNPYQIETIENFLYKKNWIDVVQWHYEDLIRNPDIDPVEAVALKRVIDKSNQDRTDLVELIDSYFLTRYKHIIPRKDAVINTESPAWALDRLSILAVKIYHMQQETQRLDASSEHLILCKEKLSVLLEQKNDLSQAVNQLLSDIEQGNKYMKVYKQMKMYNDPNLNPVLYSAK